ncbi:hypothetical protein NDU88_003218 [Pleurodeles waltl]|uniref:Uncharacterized protein n=1 Tax=Pleurodeles waltl TaxID=8319 RepID=A0AAV7VGU4_PLEWA|nr:hypothetical protein NDU88_003218 [Pleurodeles waltl]
MRRGLAPLPRRGAWKLGQRDRAGGRRGVGAQVKVGLPVGSESQWSGWGAAWREVWRWMNMWDKVAPDRSELPESLAGRVTGVDGSDWRNHGESQTEVFAGWGGSRYSRIEIQQDGTMAMVVPELAAGLTVAPELEVEMTPVYS